MRQTLFSAAVLLSVLGGCEPQSTAPPEDPDGAASLEPSDPIEAAARKMADGDSEGALALLEEALASTPRDHELLFSKGVALRKLGRTDDALAAWNATLSIEPDFFGALHAKGAVFLERQAWDEAIDALQAAASAKPDYADAHYNLGLAILGQGGPNAVSKAQRALETAASLDAEDLDVALLLADLYIKQNRLDDAKPVLEAAVGRAPQDARVQATLGRLALKEGDGAAALAAFDKALAVSAADAGYQLGQAQAMLRLNRSAEAEAKLAALSKRAPESAVVWLEWGTALAKQGKLKPALEKMDEALKRAPHLISAQVRRIGLLSDLGRCNDAKAAMRTLREATEAQGALKVAQGAASGCKR
ncbi:MAG: tetratricopeptide repeat protein [Nannocystaceae bacterium]|nr:tetratricopeptide repeat protein [Nannocystaceae bacterium]